MKNSLKVGVAFLSLLVISGSAVASGSLAGIWHGRIRFDMTNLPPMKNPRLNAARVANLTKLQQMELTLTIKSDRTYTLRSLGGPRQTPQITGTWRVTGTSLSLQQTDHGRELGYPQVYTIEKTGKSFTVTKSQSGLTTTLSFYR